MRHLQNMLKRGSGLGLAIGLVLAGPQGVVAAERQRLKVFPGFTIFKEARQNVRNDTRPARDAHRERVIGAHTTFTQKAGGLHQQYTGKEITSKDYTKGYRDAQKEMRSTLQASRAQQRTEVGKVVENARSRYGDRGVPKRFR